MPPPGWHPPDWRPPPSPGYQQSAHALGQPYRGQPPPGVPHEMMNGLEGMFAHMIEAWKAGKELVTVLRHDPDR
eukprot:5707542-Alexandrium_andersonii.AAC.1